jgi:hypothetical protein
MDKVTTFETRGPVFKSTLNDSFLFLCEEVKAFVVNSVNTQAIEH